MRIRYELTIDDLVALARFQNDHSPTVRRVRVRATWIFAIVVLAITAGIAFKISEVMEEHGLFGQVITGVMVAILLISLVLSILRMPESFRRSAERQARRQFAEGENKSILGTRELELAGNELISRSTYGESRLKLEAVERVITDGNYTFIFINAVTAHVIPHEAVIEGDHEKFAEAIKNRIFPGTSY